ncbi:MAG: hypothetical protein LBN42_00160 [Oscillospiraceae bacterium]|jgi:tetrapyrrole methylase family protein/MazG family protein|nr:hypothetical protein [Oscillospiraceae bacterium]
MENVKEIKTDLAKSKYDITDLEQIIWELRQYCPWDKEQDHDTIRKNLLEESAEAMAAISNGDYANLVEELGDVLLQVLFHTQMGKEGVKLQHADNTDGAVFNFNDICDRLARKLIYRHPHVYGKVTATDVDTVLTNWEKLKQTEKK